MFLAPAGAMGGAWRQHRMLSLARAAPAALASWPTWPSWASWTSWASARPAELRIDVNPEPQALEQELDELYRRIGRRGDCLHGMRRIDIGCPGLVFHYREADGEHYVYAEDVARQRLAGYTVFNRLVELDRRADRYLRAPHSKYAPAYQRRGIASAIYRWWLEAGNCLISGARQSEGAHALWTALARDYPRFFVDLRAKRLRHLGQEVTPAVRESLHTRMILLGAGCDLASLSFVAEQRGNI